MKPKFVKGKEPKEESIWSALGVSDEHAEKLLRIAQAAMILATTKSEALEKLFPECTDEQRARIYAYHCAIDMRENQEIPGLLKEMLKHMGPPTKSKEKSDDR